MQRMTVFTLGHQYQVHYMHCSHKLSVVIFELYVWEYMPTLVGMNIIIPQLLRSICLVGAI